MASPAFQLSSFATTTFRELPGLVYLQSIGAKVLEVGLAACFVKQGLDLAKTQSCDLLTPLLRLGLAMVVLQALPGLGDRIYSGALDVSRLMGQESHVAMFHNAFSHVAKAGSAAGAFWTTSLGTMVVVLTTAVAASRMIIIEVVFPICLGIVLMSGSLSVPISLFPGNDTFGGWVKNLAEVALYPVCFQMVSSQMTAYFSGLLKAIAAADFGDFVGMYTTLWNAKGNLGEALPQTPFWLLLQFFVFLAVYIFLTFFSPFIAIKIMRGRSVNTIGGMLAARGAAMMTKGVSAMVSKSPVASAVLGRVGAGSFGGAVPSAASAAGTSGAQGAGAAAGSAGASDINKRNFRVARRS